jgi:ornithine decarboxylase
VVARQFPSFRKALPDSRIFYAVKANPGAGNPAAAGQALGSNFDTASVAEIEMALDAGATPTAFPSATPSRKNATSPAPTSSASLFAVDCVEEVEKIARAAPGARVFCRVLTDGEGAEWPLSRKFGCVPQMAVDVLVARRPPRPRSPMACPSMSVRR